MNRITVLSLGAAAVLVAMVAITAASGVSQETFEIVRHPSVYSQELRLHALPLRALFGLDTAFLILYTTLLLAFAQRLVTAGSRLAIGVAIGAILGTAVLDMIEDHHILALLRAAEHGLDATVGQIELQHTLSQVKFNLSYLGLFLLGLHVPRDRLAGTALAWLLTVGTLVQGAWLFAAPDDLLPIGNVGRWLGFLAGFALIIPIARRPAGAGAATGAPA